MIITRTPFRVSFCGGGSDLPSFYKKHGGCVLSAGIDKYMYISAHPSFTHDEIVLKYSKTEIVKNVEDIEHKYFKAMLKKLNVGGIELVSTADVPAGTGLGSSSSFTVGLLHTLYAYTGKYVSKERLAQEACYTEIIELEQPIGKQDQYAAAYGGLNFYTFNKDGSVFVEPMILPPETLYNLENNIMMFYIGGVHSASSILHEQGINVTQGEKENNQIKMCNLAKNLRDDLHTGKIESVGEILNESWNLKKTLAKGISNPFIDEKYALAMESGALGGKLLGAGGCGFLLFYVPKKNQDKVRKALQLKEITFGFDMQGSSVIYIGQKPNM